MTTRKWLIPLAVLSVVWGSSFLFIEVGIRELTPLQVALARVLLGAATIAVVLAVSRTPLPASRRMWRHIAVVAVTFEHPVHPVRVGADSHFKRSRGIWNATTPLWTVPMALSLIPSAALILGACLG